MRAHYGELVSHVMTEKNKKNGSLFFVCLHHVSLCRKRSQDGNFTETLLGIFL